MVRGEAPVSSLPGAEAMASRTTAATVSLDMPRLRQYFDSSQTLKGFVPLLALQPMQHLAMFVRVTRAASFTMCSHDGLLRRAVVVAVNSTWQ